MIYGVFYCLQESESFRNFLNDFRNCAGRMSWILQIVDCIRPKKRFGGGCFLVEIGTLRVVAFRGRLFDAGRDLLPSIGVKISGFSIRQAKFER